MCVQAAAYTLLVVWSRLGLLQQNYSTGFTMKLSDFMKLLRDCQLMDKGALSPLAVKHIFAHTQLVHHVTRQVARPALACTLHSDAHTASLPPCPCDSVRRRLMWTTRLLGVERRIWCTPSS